jgi:S1-C subfamily serine protease
MVKRLILGLLVVVFLVSCVSLNRFKSSVHEDISLYVHTIKAEFTSELPPYEPMNQVVTSTSFHIGKGYLVTCAHCVKFDYVVQYTFFGPLKVPIKSYNYKYTINGDPVELIGTYDDVALLYNEKLIGTPFVRFGDSNKLKPGDNIINVGNSMMAGNNLKDGMVSKIGIDKPLFDMHKRTAKATLIISIPVNGGDSGSPIFAERNGKHYFVGMVYASYTGLQGYNMAFASNYIRKAIEEIRNTVTKPI